VSTLAHRYRAEAGGTPMARLARLRVERAQALIASGMPLAAVAAACGFCDAFHLSKTFRRLVGVPPARWRLLGGGRRSGR
jgi:transcriptional regulator GlxA family with amidase domain